MKLHHHSQNIATIRTTQTHSFISHFFSNNQLPSCQAVSCGRLASLSQIALFQLFFPRSSSLSCAALKRRSYAHWSPKKGGLVKWLYLVERNHLIWELLPLTVGVCCYLVVKVPWFQGILCKVSSRIVPSAFHDFQPLWWRRTGAIGLTKYALFLVNNNAYSFSCVTRCGFLVTKCCAREIERANVRKFPLIWNARTLKWLARARGVWPEKGKFAEFFPARELGSFLDSQRK